MIRIMEDPDSGMYWRGRVVEVAGQKVGIGEVETRFESHRYNGEQEADRGNNAGFENAL